VAAPGNSSDKLSFVYFGLAGKISTSLAFAILDTTFQQILAIHNVESRHDASYMDNYRKNGGGLLNHL